MWAEFKAKAVAYYETYKYYVWTFAAGFVVGALVL